MTHSLVVLPDDTAKPILDTVDGAKRSLNVRMFLFTEPTLLQALIAARQRGVEVRVMLNPARRNGIRENDMARTTLTEAFIEVRDSIPSLA